MKRYLEQPILNIKDDAYLTLLIVIAPLLNFLPGLNIDMYAPSMPAIADRCFLKSLSQTAVINTQHLSTCLRFFDIKSKVQMLS